MNFRLLRLVYILVDSIISSSLFNRSRIVSILLQGVNVIFGLLSALSQFPCQVTEIVVYVRPFLFYHSANVCCVRLHSIHHLSEFPFHDLQDVVAFIRPRFASMSMQSKCIVHNHCATACIVRSTLSVNSLLTASHSLCVLLSSARCHCFVGFSKNNEQNLPIFAPQSDGILSMMHAHSYHRLIKSN